MSQSKLESWVESFTNAALGFFIAFLASFIIFPMFGIDNGFFKNFGMTFCYTVVSIIRSYIVRRIFNSMTFK